MQVSLIFFSAPLRRTSLAVVEAFDSLARVRFAAVSVDQT